MPVGFETPKLVAGGAIRPSRFVKFSASADRTILEADANERTIAIATDAERDAPQTGSSTEAAAAGEPCHVNMPGVVCKLKLGSGGTTRGNMLKSDADGQGVDAATSGTTLQWVGAIALESGSEGELIDVLVIQPMPYRPAIA